MLIDGIRLPVGADITDTVTNPSDRVTTLPGSVTNGRIIELTQQDGVYAPGIYTGVSGVWVFQQNTVDDKINNVSFYDIAGTVVGKPDASASVLHLVTPRMFVIPNAFVGSKAVCGVASTGTAVFTIKKWNTAHTSFTSLGTITFSAGSMTGTFAQIGSGDMTIAVGESLEMVAPSSQNSTLSDVGYVLSCTI